MTESFSEKAKSEACAAATKYAAAEIYGFFLAAARFSRSEISLSTSSESVFARAIELIRLAFDLLVDGMKPAVAAGKRFSLKITDRDKIKRVFDAFGYAENTAAPRLNLAVLETENEKRAFLRGFFLAGGSISDPEKNIYLELRTTHASISREALSLLIELGFSPKRLDRGGKYYIYFKSGSAIEDFLVAIGAQSCAVRFMELVVLRQSNAEVTRRMNCDNYNTDRIASTSSAQIAAIEELLASPGRGELPQKLLETAELRIANPGASLAELASQSSPPVSKSCIQHRLRLLMQAGGDLKRG
ncbi:MAG: DNA-binding protein WhiA [Oscillospiraceae bacterium]|jgi:DNA-binding protein WhiA|nr:DNA-binding protein WhiA [Oscillospiraceae bacterium]